MPIANAESINHKCRAITLACQNMYMPNKKLKWLQPFDALVQSNSIAQAKTPFYLSECK